METLTYNGNMTNTNGNNSNRPHPTKPRSNNFSHAAVSKTDVGDFQAGYFVMADMPYQPQPQHKQKNNNNRTLERHSSEKRNQRPPQQPHRARSTTDFETHTHPHTRESDSNVSQGRLTTSPHRSPTRSNKRNSHSPPQSSLNSQSSHTESLPLSMSSPHKPRKAPHEKHVESVSHTHVESGSPPKDKGPSPTPNRWAGPAFSNAPPPSSLPLPDFPPFAPSSSSSSSVSSSPPASSPISQSASTTSTIPFLAPRPVYQEPLFFNHQSLYPAPYPPHFNAHFSFAEATPAQSSSLAQLSTDLRRMLNITPEPVHA